MQSWGSGSLPWFSEPCTGINPGNLSSQAWESGILPPPFFGRGQRVAGGSAAAPPEQAAPPAGCLQEQRCGAVVSGSGGSKPWIRSSPKQSAGAISYKEILVNLVKAACSQKKGNGFYGGSLQVPPHTLKNKQNLFFISRWPILIFFFLVYPVRQLATEWKHFLKIKRGY